MRQSPSSSTVTTADYVAQSISVIPIEMLFRQQTCCMSGPNEPPPDQKSFRMSCDGIGGHKAGDFCEWNNTRQQCCGAGAVAARSRKLLAELEPVF